MNVENFIEGQYRELKEENNLEYLDLYKAHENSKLSLIFSALHFRIVQLFEVLNERLPSNANENNHFWADPSRSLISSLRKIQSLQRNLKSSVYSFSLDKYYEELFEKCLSFLCNSGGSTIPDNMEVIEIYHTIPIFILNDNLQIKNNTRDESFKLNVIGEGSYAKVFKFFDNYYNKTFVLKRAKKNLSEKEIKRFKIEFIEMNQLKSPYVIEVYKYIEANNEYIMEYMDFTLEKFLLKIKPTLSFELRKNICFQVLKGIAYIHSKDLLHRDLSPNNILVKSYDDLNVVKISDFGLVKTTENNLTSIDSEMKGMFNDPELRLHGFSNYNMSHETYAITMLIAFIMTGKTNVHKIKEKKLLSFIQKGLHSDKDKRFKDSHEILKQVKLFT